MLNGGIETGLDGVVFEGIKIDIRKGLEDSKYVRSRTSEYRRT
jgi:hypothetical protein